MTPIRSNYKLQSTHIKLIEQAQVMGSTWCNQFLSSWNIFQKTVLFYFVHVSKSKVKEKEEIVDSWSIWKQTREQQKPIYFL